VLDDVPRHAALERKPRAGLHLFRIAAEDILDLLVDGVIERDDHVLGIHHARCLFGDEFEQTLQVQPGR